MIGREKLAATIGDAAEKAGTLVTAALALSGVALLIACVALIVAVRHAG